MFSLSKRQMMSSARQICGRGVSPRVRLAGVMMCGALTALLTLPAGAAPAAPPTTATTTTLAVMAGGNAVTTVASGTVVALTATVTAGTTSVRPAQVAFCDATATSCTGPHLLGIAQITGSGTAIYRFVPGVGAHSYRAVFLGTPGGTTTYGASASATTALMVTGTIATTTTIAQSGTAPNITLKATTVGADPYPAQNPTQSVTINLGQSAQNYVLTGTGPSSGNGGTYGNYYNTQGSCVTSGATTTCDLTGSFTSSTAGYASGTYDFQTVFTGSITTSITSQTVYPVGSQEPNPFTYSAFAPSLTMALKLIVDGGGAYTIPVAENANFDPNLDLVNFADVAPACAGLPQGDACQEDTVGTVPGATYTGLVTGVVEFEMPVPPTLVGPTGTVSFLDTSNANAVLATAALGAATGALGFGNGSTNAASTGSSVGTPGDFNGDGKLDLVFTNRVAGTLTVLLGKGDGTFTAAPSVAVGAVPAAVALADFDGDGNLDIAVANQGSNTVTILLGKGNGTFTAFGTAPATGSAPAGIVSGDFNGDGIADLIVTNQNDQTVTILLGNGDGTFAGNEPFETTNTPGAIVAGDFNGDGKLDLAIAVTNGVNIYLGRGDGSFALSSNTATSAVSVNSLAVADLNNDGKLDLVAADDAGYPASTGNGGLFVLLGNGDGTFTAAASPAVGANPTGVVAADLNGDGMVDLAVTNIGDSTATVLLGKGDGTFTAASTQTTGNAPTAITAGDFNDDGYSDLVIASEGAESQAGPAVSVLLAQLTQTAVATATGIAPAAGTHQVVASYPGDGNFATSVSQPTAVVVGSGQTTPVITWAMPAAITTTTPLSGTQLDATAATANGTAIPGTYVYSPAAGTMLAAGTRTLSVTFTPTDTTDFTTATKTTTIVVTQAAAPRFVSNVGTALAAQAVTVGIATGGTVQSIRVLTRGVAGLDFTAASGGSCASGTAYTANQSCTVNVIFDPQHAGTRAGAVLLLDGNKQTIGITYLQGLGNGPQIIFGGGSQSVLGGGLSSPEGLGIDGAGNVYVSDLASGFVKEIPLDCTSAACVKTLASGFMYPNGLAVDGAGNVFFDDFSNSNNSGSSSSDNLVEEIPFGCTSASCFRTLGSGFNLLVGVAVDLSGDVFVSDFGNNAVKELVAVNGVVPASPTINVLAGGFSGQTGPDGLTLDASGNVYVTNHDNGHALYEIPIAGGYSTLNTVSNGFTAPEDVAFDGTGNAFVVDEDTNSLYELPAAGGSLPASPSVNVLANNFNSPEGVVVDALGNVYVADYGNSRVVKIDYSDAPSVSFATATTVGSTDTTDGPQKVTIQNNGNATMSFTGIAASTNFKVDSATTTCSTTVGLAAGSSCVVGVNFAPTAAGVLSGTLTLTDDALNAAGATQAIALSGTGVAAAAPETPVITWAMPAAITTATPLSATQLDATAADANGTAVPGAFVYTPAAGAMLAAGTQTLSVTFTPTNTAAFTTATKTVSIVVTQATTAPAATTTTLAVTSGNEAVTTVAAGSVVTLTASVSAAQNSVTPGQVAFCDAAPATCTGSHLLATAELVGGDTTSTATYRFVPGIGAHSYEAVFLGTTVEAGSASTAAALAVSGTVATTSVLTSAGTQGSYALTATVAGFGPGSPAGNVVFTDTSKNAVLGTMPVSAAVRNFVTGGTIPGAPVAVGSAPTQVVSADVNGDGKLDLVVANGSGTMVTVLIGKGDGTYTAMPSFGTNYSGITGISVGDFNGDGKLDIATANGSSVGIFLGSGHGTFGAEQDFTNTGASQGVFAADLNGDGKLDLVVTDNNSGITIMIGNGDGTFTQPNGVYTTGGGPNFSLAVADFNGDGKLDVAFGNKYDNTLSVLLGNGDGTFQTQKVTTAGSAPRAAASGDFNGDGKPDIVLFNAGGTVSILLGNGDGTFQAEKTYAIGANAFGGAVGDLNGDGKLDIAVANQNDGTVSVLYGNGDGTFQTQQVLTAGGGADYVAIGDVNGDGSPDLAVANAGDSTVSVFLNEAPSAVTLPGVTLPGTGMDNVVATYAGDTVFTGSTSNTLTLASNVVGTTVITWTPAVATIGYGTALGAQQLDATAATAAGVAIPGTFVYTPAAGTVLTAGTQTLGVTFTPTSAAYAAATGTATITVTKATPSLAWANPATIATGTPLNATQLDATATGVGGAALPGTFAYTPTAGTLLAPGSYTLSTAFTPTDAVDYTTSTATVPLTVSATGCPVPGLTNSSMNITYFTLAETDKDANFFPINSVSSNYVLPALGKNGLPVYNPAATATSGTIEAPNDLLADHEITWWSPALNNGGAGGAADVVQTGTGVVAVPFNNNSFYPPNGTGPGDGSGFQTAVLTGTLFASTPGSVSFSISSDDMAFLYLDGQIACNDGGDHGATAVPCTTSTIAAGSHSLQVFYSDLTPSGAVLDFSLTSTNALVTASQLVFGTMKLSPTATEARGTNQAITISIPVTYSGPAPTGAVSFGLNGVNYAATCSTAGQANGQETCSAVAAAATIAALPAAAYPVTGSFGGDCNYPVAMAVPAALTITAAATPQTITFGALAGVTFGAAPIALTATASSGLPVSYAVTGPATVTGSTLTITAAGSVTVTASQAGNGFYLAAAPVSQSFAVGKAVPTITWAAPAGIAYGTALSAAQLDATVAGVGTGALAGTLVYTPIAGTVLTPGMHTLSVAFTPIEAVDYTGRTASVNIVVGGLGLSGIAPLGAVLGSANTTITLTGTGFVPTSVVLAGTNRLATKYENGTTLTAVVPATLLGATGPLAITVNDPAIAAVSAAQTFTVLPVVPAATLTGPAITAPGTQPTVGLTITNPYPLALTAQFTLTFASAGSTPVDDPSIQFSTGGRMYSYAVAANSTTVPPVQLQAGTDAGTITITATLMADGVDVTPTGLAPLVIVVPPVVPVISGTTITASGNMLTVVVHGFSNTREVSQAVFDFTAATGDTVATPSLTIPATTIFTTWYSDATSDAYGSTFTYTQIFNTSGDAKTVGTVKVTLTNSVGVSAVSTSAGTGP